jgi:hypothetical protein
MDIEINNDSIIELNNLKRKSISSCNIKRNLSDIKQEKIIIVNIDNSDSNSEYGFFIDFIDIE